MAEFYEKRRLRKLVHSPPVLAIFALFVLFIASAAWSAYHKQIDTRNNRQEAAARLASLELREKTLKDDIAALDTEGGIESEIRDRFDVGKAGERKIVIVDPPPISEVPTTTPKKSWLKKLFSWF